MAAAQGTLRSLNKAKEDYKNAEEKLKELQHDRTQLMLGLEVDTSELDKISEEIQALSGELDPNNPDSVAGQWAKLLDFGNQRMNLEGGGREWFETPEGKKYRQDLDSLRKKKDELEAKMAVSVAQRKAAMDKLTAEQERLDKEARIVHKQEIKALENEIQKQKDEVNALEKQYQNFNKQWEAEVAAQQKIAQEEARILQQKKVAKMNTPAAKKNRARQDAKLAKLEQQKHLTVLSQATGKKILSGQRQLHPGEGMPLNVRLDTSINKDGSRNHTVLYKQGKKEVDSIFGKKFRTPSQIASALSAEQYKGDYAARFGTAHHKIVEDLLGKNGITATGKDGELTRSDLEKYLVKTRAQALLAGDKGKETLEDLSIAIGDKGLNKTQITKLLRTTNDFLNWKKQAGISDEQVLSEKTLGAVLKTPKGRIVPMGGTIDQLWFDANKGTYKLTDNKTSNTIDPKFGLQLSIYKMLADINGIPVSDLMEVAHTPREGGMPSAGHVLQSLGSEKVLELIDLFEDLNGAKPGAEQEAIRKKMNEALGMGGLKLGVRQVESAKSSTGTKNLIGTHTLSEWAKIGQLENLLSSISDEEQARHVKNLIYKRGQNGGFLYGDKEFDDYRMKHRPELYNIGSEKWLQKYDWADEGMAGEASAMIGGMSVTDWLNYIGSFEKGSEGRDKATHTMLSLLDSLSIGRGQAHASKAWARDVYWSGRFLTTLSNRDTYDPEHAELLNEILGKTGSYGNLRDLIAEKIDPTGTGQKWDVEESRAMQDYIESITPRVDEEDTEKYKQEILNAVNPGGGRQISGNESEQIAHRWARLLNASSYYDRVYDIDKRFAEWQGSHPNSKLDREGFARIFMGRSGNGQWTQYQSSQKASEWFRGLPADIMVPSKDGTIPFITELSKLDDNFFGDDPEAVNFLRTVKKVHENYPSMLMDQALTKTITGKNGKSYTVRTPYSDYIGQAIANKQAWWDNNEFNVLVKTGRRISTNPIDEFINPSEAQAEQTAKGQIDENVLAKMRAAQENDDTFAYNMWASMAKKRMPEYADRAALIAAVRKEGWDQFNALGGAEHWKKETGPVGDEIEELTPEQQALIDEAEKEAEKTVKAEKKPRKPRKPRVKKEEVAETPTTTSDVTEPTVERVLSESIVINTDSIQINSVKNANLTGDIKIGESGSTTGEAVKTSGKTEEFSVTGKTEKDLQKIQSIYAGILRLDKQIYDNEQSISSLSDNRSAKAESYKNSLIAQNNLLKEQKAAEAGKLVGFHKAGVDLSLFGRKYAVDAQVYRNKQAFKSSSQIGPTGAPGGGGSGGGGFKFGGMNRTSWYSLDGRALHWIERMLNGGMWLSFFNMMRKGLKTLINLSKDLDKYMTNIRIVTGTTREQAQTLTSSFIQLSQKLGVTAEEVLKAATEFYRQGYQTAEVENLVSSATKLSRLGMIDMTKSVQDITSAMKGFKLSTEQSIDVVDKLTAIDMKAAVSAGEIAEGLAQFANLANVNGVDLDQAAAYVATIAEVTQKGGSATGSALKMIMSRYGNVKAGAYNKLNIDTENTDTSQDLNDVEKVLKKLGISVRDANLNFKDFDVILDEIAERWNDLDNVTKRAIATSFAGTRQQEQFLTLMENYDKYKKLLDVSRNSAGTADKKYESYLESYEAAKNELQNAVKELANNAQINKILTDVTKSITKVFKTFIPWLMRQLPWLMHLLLDVRTMMGKSVIQKTGTKLVDFARGGGFWQGIPGLRSRARVPSTGVYTTGGPTGSGYATSAGGIPLVYTYNGGSVSATGNYSVGSGSDYSTSYLTGSGATSDSYAIATGDNLTYNTTTGGTDISSKSIKSAGAKMGGGSAVSGILFAVSMFTNMIASAITAFKTSGVTHKNAEGETVESSENAQKAAGSTAAMLAMIPFGIGSMVDSLFGISEGIAAQIDAEKDAAATATKNAEKVISSLNSMDNKLDQIANYGIGSDAFNKALNEMLVDLYSDDNKESREALEKVLGGPGELRNNINRIKTGSEQEAKAALRELKLAELEAKKEKIQDKYATQRYNNAAEISKKLSAVNDYKGENHGWIWAKDIGIGVGGGAATGAIAGAAIGSVVPVIGTAIGAVAGAIIGGIAGLIGGIFAGKKETDALKEEDKKKYERETAWGRMSMSQKILDTQERIDKALEDGNGEYAGKLQDLLDALNTQNALSNQIIDELNDISLEQAYIGAVYKDDRGNEIALQDMSVAQLKNLGVDKILEIYGQAAIDSGLIGQSLFDDNGKLTDSAYNYLLPKLRSQDDDEIRSVLSGEAYTLKEALALKDQFPDSIYVDRLLQSFALSLNTTTDGLADLSDALGSLSLAETYMSTTELSDRLNSYTGLLDSISTGAGNTSEWMNTIINQFPELIAYMGDTSTLFDKIGEKVGALSEQYINAQYAAVSSSADTYNAIKKDFYNKIGDSGITALLDKANVTSIEGVTEFLRTQYGADGKLTEIGETVKNALAETVDEFGMSITSSVLKGYYDKVIEFKTKVLDAQIKNLNEQKEALQNINKQREYENQLIEAKLKLENASKEKRRVYRAGVGWVYEADQGAIAKAQTEYDQLQNQKTVSDLEMQIATLESEKNRLTSIYDEQNYETLSDFYTSYMKKTDDSLSLYSNMADGITGISSSVSELVDKTVNADKENREKAISAAQKAWQDLQRSSPGSADYNNKLEAYHNAYSAAVNAGMTQDDTANWGKTDIAGKGSQGAWDVGTGDVNKQKVAPSLHFKLADPSDSGKSFEGVVDMGVTQYDSQIHEWILNDLKNGKAFVWTKGSGGVNPKNDARFKYDGDSSLTNYIKRLKDLGVSEFVITGWDGGQESVYVKDGVPYAIRGWNAADDPNGLSRIKGAVGTELWAQQLDAQNMPNAKYARGTLGVSLINELGTEAIVTPHGTITALPSHTGVVPADITKNLWELGKVAPSIMRTLELQMRDITLKGAGLGNTDESFNVGTINMTVNADGTFDADAFVESVKMRASLTRNTNR